MLYYRLVSHHITGYGIMCNHVISYEMLSFDGLTRVQSVSSQDRAVPLLVIGQGRGKGPGSRVQGVGPGPAYGALHPAHFINRAPLSQL